MIAASIGLFLLVVARMAVLVVQQERSVERERALREAGAALVGAAGRADIGAAGAVRDPDAGRLRLLGAPVPALGRAAGADRAGAERRHPALPRHDPSGCCWRRRSGRDRAARGGLHQALFSERPRTAHVLALEVRDEGRGVLLRPAPATCSAASARPAVARDQCVLALEGAALTRTCTAARARPAFSSLVARSSDLITVVAADGTVLYQSPSIERVLRLRRRRGHRHPLRRSDGRPRARPAAGGAVVQGQAARLRPGGDRLPPARPRRTWLQFEVLHTNLLDDGGRRHRAEQPRRHRAQGARGASSRTRPSTTR